MVNSVLDNGFVSLVRSCGGDQAVVDAARVTTGSSARTPEDDRRLIRYLMRHEHSSPFEFCTLEFHVRAPIFVARQWVRHRTASWGEASGRYGEVREDHHVPLEWRGRAVSNLQGSEGCVEYQTGGFLTVLNQDMGDGAKAQLVDPFESPLTSEKAAWAEYHRRLAAGVAPEQARGCLPLSTYTEWRWATDLRNCLNFLRLRLHPRAQKEIRLYAECMLEMVRGVAPMSVDAWETYERNAVKLSALDLHAIRMEAHTARELILDVGMSPGEALDHLEHQLGAFKNFETHARAVSQIQRAQRGVARLKKGLKHAFGEQQTWWDPRVDLRPQERQMVIEDLMCASQLGMASATQGLWRLGAEKVEPEGGCCG